MSPEELIGLPLPRTYAQRHRERNAAILRALVGIMREVHRPVLVHPPTLGARGVRFVAPRRPAKPQLYSRRTRQPLTDSDFTPWLEILRGTDLPGLGVWQGRYYEVEAVIRAAMRQLRISADPSIN